MRLNKAHKLAIVFSIMIIVADIIFFRGDNLFFFLIGIAVLIVALPFIVTIVMSSSTEKENNERFLEFSRNLAESVKTGTPIGRSIINMRNKNFGSLTPYIQKLSNQISMGIPVGKALETFALDIDSITIKRAISLIREAESAGGQIDNILDSVANAIYQIEKLKKERKAAIYNLVVQGYIIFFIFIGIMLIMQFKILPLTSDIGDISTSDLGLGVGGVGGLNPDALSRSFLYLLLIQGIFTGLTVGKLAEGSVKAGIKHSFILTITALLISTGATAFL